MSSIPQGWHGFSGPTKPASSASGISGSSVPVIIRKKWNSPMSNVPESKLPSYKTSNLRLQKNCDLNNTYQVKPNPTACPASQTKLPIPTKPSPVKEYQNEIAKIKKELATMKAENSILKAKVRRVDDENLQKGRQIEKMRAEIKALQKNESSSNNRKSKESQELLTLRQKCLRLESALKDKDIAMKKLSFESTKWDNQDATKTSSIQKQICSVRPAIQNVTAASKANEKESISTAKSSQSRASLSLKTEVTKLRDMIHKLEKENQDLQQQAKLHCQEIRRLKVQLKSKDKTTLPQTSISNSGQVKNCKNIPVSTICNGGKIPYDVNTSSSIPKNRPVKSTKSPLQYSIARKSPVSVQRPTIPQKTKLPRSDPKSGKPSRVPNETVGQPIQKKQTKDIPSKLPITKSNQVHPVPKSVIKKTYPSKSLHASVEKSTKIVKKEENIEQKVQEMRENIAAKKIQRSWRQHQKYLNHSIGSEFQNEEKALTFIVSSLKHHKSRKDKLKLLAKKKNLPNEEIMRETFMEIIRDAQKRIWDQEISDS